jgi:hypothetical protein
VRLLSAAFGGSAHRRATTVIALLLLVVALTLLSIGANSPYTHANLNVAYDDRYTRTSSARRSRSAASAGPWRAETR